MSKIVLFDMDGTLTEPRKEIKVPMIKTLRDLQKDYEIGVVTGSDFDYIKQQLDPAFDLGGISLRNLHLFPCNGTKYYKWKNTKFSCEYSADMIEMVGRENYRYLIQTLFSMQLLISVRYDLPYTGTFFQYRGSMLNWCPVGRTAGDEERKVWIEADKKFGIRKEYTLSIEDAIQAKNMPLQVALGGSTSFDIFPKGWDKTYVLKHLDGYKHISFIGDACQPGGNDHELYTLLKDGDYTQSYATTDPQVTSCIVEKLILGGSE